MFEKQILKILKELNAPDTIYVLKGFNRWVCDAVLPFLFGKEPDTSYADTNKVMQNYNLKLMGLGAETGQKFIFFEDLLLLNNKNLAGMFGVFNKKLVIVNNDFYGLYCPSVIDKEKAQLIQTQYEKETDTLPQIYYGDVQEYNNIEYVAYNDIYGLTTETVEFSKLLAQDGFRLPIENPETSAPKTSQDTIEVPDEFDDLMFADLITTILENGAGKVVVLKDLLKTSTEMVDLKNKLEPLGVEFETREYKPAEVHTDEDRTSEYLEILRRKNPNYNFRDISIYENPYESNELTSVSQVKIIDDIVSNSLMAQKQESFRDVFVTAPTGAGKSVMFQIPAIYLAEKENLLTLVVTPLIGLMKDQVMNVASMTDLAATINSDYTPIEKEMVLEQVRKGEKSILYLSPESLLSNSDITSLIGGRKIGLVVVDEAHIVTTWGKNFRPDYWYLGDFINKIRNDTKTDTNFPIVTFTATATFGLDADSMYRETIESLKMTPNKYIGNVRRDDISFEITQQEVKNDYASEKLKCAAKHIDELIETGEKTLIYTPYKRHIEQLESKLKTADRIGIYHGAMQGGQKDETLKNIISGNINGVIATKAFGMGIDVDDIKYVYHFAPTGNISDYVQEIGRAARREGMTGVALTDFYKEDFRYINALYGMSSIRNSHIIGVLRQILDTYRQEGSRNFMMSTDDFMWVFGDSHDIEEVDRKLKTALLMIKKDFDADHNINYSPIIFKPRTMFTYGYFMVRHDFIPELKAAGLMKYFKNMDAEKVTKEAAINSRDSEIRVTSMGDTYRVNLKQLWEDRYRDLSFGMFKYSFMSNTLKDFDFKVGDQLLNRIIIEVDTPSSLGEVYAKLETFFESLKSIFEELARGYKYFSLDDFAKILVERKVVNKKYVADMLAGSIIPMLQRVETHSMMESLFATYNGKTGMWRIENSGYEKRIYILNKMARQFLFGNDNHTVQYVNSVKGNDVKRSPSKILVAQIISMLELASCNITSGSRPEFFIRVNNALAIEQIVNNPNYKSRMVGAVARKHHESQILMSYFFTKLSSDKERWDFIEKYFLSQLNPADYEV